MTRTTTHLIGLLSATLLVVLSGIPAAHAGAGGALAALWAAVENDDHAAYVRARQEALDLPEAEFAVLVETLVKREGWQAMAMRDGLALRRDRPEVAKDFDERLQEILDNPLITQVEGRLRYEFRPTPNSRGLPRTPEVETLSFEAALTKIENGQIRRDLLGWGARCNPASVRRLMALLEDIPEWYNTRNLASGLRGIAGALPGSIDEHAPRLLEFYYSCRREPGWHSMETARMFMLAISRTSPAIARPALDEIRQFERETMDMREIEPWELEVHEYRQKASLWRQLNEAIDSLDAEAAREPGD